MITTSDHEIQAQGLTDMRIGDRVQLHPATDAWMMGDRYGVVAKIGRLYVHVRMDRSGRTLRVHPDNVTDINE